MKHLIAFTALILFVGNANAVTPAKPSTAKPVSEASAAITEAPVIDEKLSEELAKEVSAEEPPLAIVPLPPTQAAAPAAAAPALEQQAPIATTSDQPATTESLMQPTAAGDLTLDDNAIEAETAANLAAQESITTTEEVMPKNKERNWYISGMIGTIGYPDVSNINGRYAANASLGYIFAENFIFEGGMGVAQYQMESLNPSILNRTDKFNIDQYSINAAAKYRMAFGKIVPNAGIIVQLSQRNFVQKDPNNTGNDSVTTDRGNSRTTDAGVTAGIDFEMNKEFAIGVDFKYMANISNSAKEIANVNSTTQTGLTVTPIEKLQSYSAGVSARMNF